MGTAAAQIPGLCSNARVTTATPSPATLQRVARALEAGVGLAGPPAAVAPPSFHVPTPAPTALALWIDQVAAWNARIDLTAARGEDELVDLMLADALALAAHLPAGRRVVDVGTGAGAPGLALALLRPDLGVTLVEPLQKRVSFLRTVIGALLQADALRPRSGAGEPAGAGRAVAPALSRARGEDVASNAPAFDVAVSRATLAPPRWLELGASLTAGAAAPEVWVLLAREDPPSLGGWSLDLDLRYRWPLTGAERRIVRYITHTAGS